MSAMHTATTSIAILVVLAGSVLLAGCQHSRWSESRWRELPAEERAEEMTKWLARRLDLEDDQRREANVLALELIQETEAFRISGEGLHTAVADEMRKDQPDPARIESQIRGRLAEFEAMTGIISEKMVRFHAILTPAQRNKLAEEIERHATWGHHRHRF